MSMFNDIICGYKDNETECIANSTLVSLVAKRFPAGSWSFFGPGSERSGVLFTTEELRRSDPRDQVRVFRPTLILRPKTCMITI